VLCLPLVKQAKLVGALYLENNLTPCAFTSDRIAVLEVLASQAAISLENARLYSDLQHSEAFLAEGQSISSTGSFGWNVASGELDWSDETYKIFQYDRAVTPTVALGLQRVHPDDRAFVQETIARASREMTNFDVENRLLMDDGTVKHVHVIGHAVQNSSGCFDFVGAVMDVTEQKLAQAERERLEQRLRQAEKMEAVGRLAGGIAHDFNNVLAGVFAYGEMVLDEAPEGSPLRRYAQNVLTAASRGRELVEQILAYSRSQRGKRAPIDVAYVVAETLELIRGSLPANIHLESDAPDLPLVVFGDATQLHQRYGREFNLEAVPLAALGERSRQTSLTSPSIYFSFDGRDLRSQPLSERRAALRAVLLRCAQDDVRLSDAFEYNVASVAEANEVALLLWSPLAGGYLNGKNTNGSGGTETGRTMLHFLPSDPSKATSLFSSCGGSPRSSSRRRHNLRWREYRDAAKRPR
jgi:signal transduction histidine kinase